MKKAILYSLLGLSAYCFFLVKSLPAAVVWQLAPSVPGLEISNLSGSVWSGRAEEIRFQGVQVNSVVWEFQPFKLLTAQLGLDFSVGHARSSLFVRGQLTFDGRELNVTDLQARSSLDYVQTQLPVTLPAELSGNIHVTASELVLDQTGCQSLRGQIRLQQGEIDSPLASLDLGQIDSSVNCHDNSLHLSASQQSDMFESTGQLNISFDGRYSLESQVTTTSATPEGIIQGLAFISQENNEDTYQLNFNGRI